MKRVILTTFVLFAAVVAGFAPAQDGKENLSGLAADAELTATQTEVPKLLPAGAYVPKGNVLDVELSEYAGYAGLVVANGGLEPNEASIFFKKHGFKLKITLSEEDAWSALNSGKLAASATTADVLAAYGRQFQVVVPAQIGFSRGADGVVVKKELKRINALKGKVVSAAQFDESDFFIRYLAQEAGLGINMMPDLKARPDPDKLNIVYCTEAFGAGDLFLRDLKAGRNRLAGCVTWAPKTTEVVEGSGGKAHLLTTNRNLLIIADVLIVNKGFATASPDMVAGFVSGLLEGNRMVRDNPEPHLDLIAKAFKWSKDDAKAELSKVHFANLPENVAFFNGTIDSAGSFGGIFQSAVYAYGDLIKNPADADRFVDMKHLKALESGELFKDQKAQITPIRTEGGTSVEGDPLLSKDIRFLFQPNSSDLDLKDEGNLKNLEAIKKLLQVSPGSTILLRGHVDNARIEEFRKQGGEAFVRKQALTAMELSKKRAGEISRLLVEKHAVTKDRIEVVGRGWDEPLGTDSDQNRRVEVQWFTLE
jgi:NitT/TauT family transport system substrate-binding protein